MSSLVYLSTYPHHSEAEAIKGLLEANKINCFIQPNESGDALMGGFGVIDGPVDIWVLPQNLQEASELIKGDQ